jgi:hypothetical protein
MITARQDAPSPSPLDAAAQDSLGNPEVQAQIARAKRVDRNYDIPYLAGYSRDGGIIYFDRRLPERLFIDGHAVPVQSYLLIHEATEKALIDVLGMSYEQAHAIATRVEHDAVVADGIAWRAYSAALEPYIFEAEHEKVSRVPPDLDLKPYEDEGDREALKKMIRAGPAPAG